MPDRAVDPVVLVTHRGGSAASRRAIAAAALDLFVTRGYAATTLQQIADAAGLHVQTIYLAYGTKKGVLAAAAEALRAGDDDPEASPADWPWVKDLLADPDPRGQLRRYAAHVRRIAPRGGPLVAEMRNAARSDPELGAFLAHAQAGRYLGPSGIVALLAAKDALRRDMTEDEAADTLFALASFESYDLLVTDRGWPADDYEHWLGDRLCEALLEPSPPRTTRARRNPRRGQVNT